MHIKVKTYIYSALFAHEESVDFHRFIFIAESVRDQTVYGFFQFQSCRVQKNYSKMVSMLYVISYFY